MPLDGALWAKYAALWRTHVEGLSPDTLTPYGGGTAVPWVFQSETKRVEVTESGLIEVSVVTGYTKDVLVKGARYTWDNWTWQIAMSRRDRAGGVDWPIYFEMAGQARSPRETGGA